MRGSYILPGLMVMAGCLTRPLAPEPDPANADDDTQPPVLMPSEALADKVDLLLLVDNSPSMADKQAVLARAVPELVDALVGGSKPVYDMHVGILTSSLGASDSCAGAVDDRAHLVGDFLSWMPDVAENAGKERPANALGSPAQLSKELAERIVGVGEKGCGLEAQLESVYRFLVQPDPWSSIDIDPRGIAHANGIDVELLKQRHAFLRPDSVLAIVVLTDEEDSWSDPLWSGGRGWRSRYVKNGYSDAGLLPRATSACAANPLSPACHPCGDDPMSKNDPVCKNLLFSSKEDSLEVRYTDDMQRRYGIAPQFPIERYVTGFRSSFVPNRASEHDETGAYAPKMNCTNPIFAGATPNGLEGDLCHLPFGTRKTQDVFLAVITGMPGDTGASAPADFKTLVGRDPAHFDQSGIDPRMIESIAPRTPGDWDTTTAAAGLDLQYACTFPLRQPRDCSAGASACECAPRADGTLSQSPICGENPDDEKKRTLQVAAKAYPGIRQLRVAQSMKDNAVIGSICGGESSQAAALRLLATKLRARLGHRSL